MADADSNYAPRSPDLSSLDHSFSLEPQPSFSSYPSFDPSPFGQPLAPQIPQTQPQPQYQQQPFYSDDATSFLPNQDLPPDPEPDWLSADLEMPPKRSARQQERKAAVDDFQPTEDVTRGIDIKTKFPVARIKRIMQADEDVGKVAQVTPVAVSKALELFMIAIVFGAADEAKARNSKRVTAVHLKQAIQKDQRFDFLLEKVEKVADAPAAQAAAAEHDGSGDEGPPKKKKRAGRKKASDGNES
ncbi:MAG: hypothetical protein M1814_002459 [Vezdaea aestivalis]|nr:MAG: hypothetical protein M1814_002459 [Vezdaea aestivalis]